ncbi:MAG: hypothetical protein JW818_04755 [Pirellulales bacterium]|nr:hypothetical protein [Pirellulales bacterium]
MRPFIAPLGALLIGMLLAASGVAQQDASPATGQAAAAADKQPAVTPRKHHTWAAFSPGAWKCVQVVTETFDTDGKVASVGVSESKTTLKEVGENKVTLEVKSSVWVAGARMDADPHTVTQGLHGQPDGYSVTVEDKDPAELVIEGKKIPCRVQQLTITSPDKKQVQKVTLHINNEIPPYILRRQVVISEGDNGDDTTTIEVDALGMPFFLPDGVKSAAHIRSVRHHAKGGTTITLAYTSPEVPGGILAHWSKEVDQEGRVVRRSALELIGYGLEPEKEDTRTGPLGRPRPPRGSRKGFRSSVK